MIMIKQVRIPGSGCISGARRKTGGGAEVISNLCACVHMCVCELCMLLYAL